MLDGERDYTILLSDLGENHFVKLHINCVIFLIEIEFLYLALSAILKIIRVATSDLCFGGTRRLKKRDF